MATNFEDMNLGDRITLLNDFLISHIVDDDSYVSKEHNYYGVLLESTIH